MPCSIDSIDSIDSIRGIGGIRCLGCELWSEGSLGIGDPQLRCSLICQGQQSSDSSRDGVLSHRWVRQGTEFLQASLPVL